jgi:hypothetical protein
MENMNRVGIILGSVLLCGYAFVAFSGIEFGDPERERIPPDVRQSPGGYRSFHFWHSGYHGGK